MNLRKWTAVIVAAWVSVPVLAAGRPACCIKPAAASPPSCCSKMADSMPKGCCKPPAAPKPEARSSMAGAVALMPVALDLSPAILEGGVPNEIESVRIARSENRAPSPADSPPDLLTLHRALLI